MHEERKTTITNESRLTIGLVITLVVFAVSATWYVSNLLNRIDNRLGVALRDRWSTTDMERWASRLERENRALAIPDVRKSQVDPN